MSPPPTTLPWNLTTPLHTRADASAAMLLPLRARINSRKYFDRAVLAMPAYRTRTRPLTISHSSSSAPSRGAAAFGAPLLPPFFDFFLPRVPAIAERSRLLRTWRTTLHEFARQHRACQLCDWHAVLTTAALTPCL